MRAVSDMGRHARRLAGADKRHAASKHAPRRGEKASRRATVGGSISTLGSQITVLALPLTAVLLFGAGPAETGVLTAAGVAPMLLFGLPAGAWVDRLPRRPIRIAADLASAAVIASVPLAAFFGVLEPGQLYLAAFLAGTCAVGTRLSVAAVAVTGRPRQPAGSQQQNHGQFLGRSDCRAQSGGNSRAGPVCSAGAGGRRGQFRRLRRLGLVGTPRGATRDHASSAEPPSRRGRRRPLVAPRADPVPSDAEHRPRQSRVVRSAGHHRRVRHPRSGCFARGARPGPGHDWPGQPGGWAGRWFDGAASGPRRRRSCCR